MSQGVRIPAPKRARRSHAERTADTGGRVKLAVIESITEPKEPRQHYGSIRLRQWNADGAA